MLSIALHTVIRHVKRLPVTTEKVFRKSDQASVIWASIMRKSVLHEEKNDRLCLFCIIFIDEVHLHK